ncbi:MAG: NUC211 domain-containing protein, partial [Olpidium bornovanus]
CRLLSHKTFAAKVVAAGGEDLEKEFLLVIEKALSVIANADTRKYPHREMDENKAASAARFWKGKTCIRVVQGVWPTSGRTSVDAEMLTSSWTHRVDGECVPSLGQGQQPAIAPSVHRHYRTVDAAPKPAGECLKPFRCPDQNGRRTHFRWLLFSPSKVRRKAIILLTAKAQTQAKFDRETSKLFLSSLRLLCSLIDVSSPDTERVATNAQTALAAIAALAQRLARPHREAFAEVVPLVVGPGGLRSPTPQVAASALVTLAVLVTELGPRVVPFLPKFVPTVLDILKTSAQGANPGVDGVTTVSGLVVLERLGDSLPQFLSPYLDDILSVSLHPALLRTSEAKAFTSEAAEKAKAVRDFLATKVAPRVLLPHVFASYGHAVKCGAESTLALLDVLGNAVTVMPRDVITAQYKKVFKFLLLAFDVRRAHGGQLGEDTSRVEDGAITAFIRLVVKLNESLFKPLFLKTVDWGTVEMAASEEEEGSGDADTGDARARLLFTYRLVSRLLDRLKSIVAPYYACLLENVLGILARFLERREIQQLAPASCWTIGEHERRRRCVQGVYRVYFTTTHTYTHSRRQFAGCHGADVPARLSEHIVPCLGQLAVTVGSDALWKPLNSQVLAQTRDDSPLVRTGALRVLSEFYARLGEEFLILLPETIPFLAELMEGKVFGRGALVGKD